MPDIETWRVIFAGLKDLGDIVLKIVGAITLPILVWLNWQNGEKIDSAAVQAKQARQVAVQLADKVDIGVAAAVNTDAIYTKSVADRSGNPDDMAKAEAAEKRLEAVAETRP